MLKSLFVCLASALGVALALLVGPGVSGQEKPAEKRVQAVIRTGGNFLPGGYEVTVVEPTGPAANLQMPGNPNIKGILDKGDVITAIDGKPFADRREFLDLLNSGASANGGKVQLTVRDVKNGQSVVWIANVVYAEMEVPAGGVAPKPMPVPAPGPGEGLPAETRNQAVLQMSGKFLPGGGLEVGSFVANGPAANLALPGDPTRRGILDIGDVITAVEGKTFRDQRQFLDLMNDAVRANGGKARLTVRDVKTGKEVDWIATPASVRMEVPAGTVVAAMPRRPPAWPAAVTRKLHTLLLVADGRPGVAEVAQVDDGLLRILLGDQIDPARLAPPVLLRESKGELARDRVLAALDALPVGPEDAVLCFYAGPGNYDSAGRYHLRLGGGEPVARSEIMDRLKARKARLTVLLTASSGVVLEKAIEEVPLRLPTGTAEPITLHWLLLRHRGVVDVDSHSPGERAFAQAVAAAPGDGVGETGGSLFALQFFKECKFGRSATEPGPTWAAFLDRVSKNVALTAAISGPADGEKYKQTPKVFELNVFPDRP
jgi:hypothetical protein